MADEPTIGEQMDQRIRQGGRPDPIAWLARLFGTDEPTDDSGEQPA